MKCIQCGNYNFSPHPDLCLICYSNLMKSKLKEARLEAERKIITDALVLTKFNKSKAARNLGIDRKTLYNKMKGHFKE